MGGSTRESASGSSETEKWAFRLRTLETEGLRTIFLHLGMLIDGASAAGAVTRFGKEAGFLPKLSISQKKKGERILSWCLLPVGPAPLLHGQV